MPIEAAIQSLETTRITWGRGIILSAFFTLIFCFIYPWLKYLLSWYTDWVDTKRIIKRHKSELIILENRKEIMMAEGALEAIKENRIQEAERRKKEFEFELEQKGRDINYSAQRERMDNELDLELHRKRKEVDIEREISFYRKHMGMAPVSKG